MPQKTFFKNLIKLLLAGIVSIIIGSLVSSSDNEILHWLSSVSIISGVMIILTVIASIFHIPEYLEKMEKEERARIKNSELVQALNDLFGENDTTDRAAEIIKEKTDNEQTEN